MKGLLKTMETSIEINLQFEREKRGGFLLLISVTILLFDLIISHYALAVPEVWNGSMEQRISSRENLSSAEEMVQKLRAQGWTCPDANDWPLHWAGQGNGMKIEWPRDGGIQGEAYGRLSGGVSGYVSGYYGTPLEESSYILTFWARGRGILRAGFLAFQVSDDRKNVIMQVSLPPLDVKVTSDKWTRYRHLVRKTMELSVHPLFQAPEGTIDFDNVTIVASNPAMDLIVEEEEKLYGTGFLIENMGSREPVQLDNEFVRRAGQYLDAKISFRGKVNSFDEKIVDALEQQIETLDPYVLSKGKISVPAQYYNDMIVLTRILKHLTNEWMADDTPIQASVASKAIVTHKPGIRVVRSGTVTVTDIRSNKVRYDENETATTKATLVNRSEMAFNGTLVALMHLDLDTVRNLTQTSITIGPDETKSWEFSYNVGPETYGRGIEVRFVNEKGDVIDSWQEYFAVAAEWFRVHQHSYSAQMKNWEVNCWTTYFNQSHWFAAEPTDFGVHPFDEENYLSGQGGYAMNMPYRKNVIASNNKVGISNTFYQTGAFCGQMGYEELRKHPEYALYDANGQFAVDPIYGGYPNPMELASPIEVGPNRKVKPYLDRKYKPWQHCGANLAMEEVVVYEANCVKDYAKAYDFDGVYIDGTMGVGVGYSYDGTPNVSDQYEEYVRLNARNHRIFSEILKKDNPNFGTWYNWGLGPAEWGMSIGLHLWLGTGSIEGDPLDDSIRAATDWNNVMLLHEAQHLTGSCTGMLEELLRDRDYFVQKYGANMIIGYMNPDVDGEEPGLSKWGWPTWNYFLSQLIATQTHLASFFIPSYRPSFQFMTRYSRFIWARDIQVVPEAEKIIQVSSAEKIWWKRLVYKRQKQDGYDLIVHLVRIPPTKDWDVNWVDEPEFLHGVKITANIGSAKLQTAHACRPFHFEEEQQIVQNILNTIVDDNKVTVVIPPFRYHTMVIFRVTNK